MKQFLCELLFSCALIAPGAQPIDELTYRNVLYEYFQQDHQGALLNTLVAQSRQRLGEDPIRFSLAEGSFAFADGMYGYATQVFEQIPTDQMTELDKMRLAFHLAREYHRRQDWARLEPQLEKIDLGKTWLRKKQKTHPEVEYMRAELAMHQGQYDTAADYFALMDEHDPLRAYGLFNLGVAYRQAGRLDEAQATFRQLAQIPAYDEEAYDLSQRAKLALALIARQRQDTQTAESVLGDLPSTGRYQETAMAAFGGLAMDNQNYELAARIWMTLQQEEYWTPATATARLGFPLSLEKMSLAGTAAQSGRKSGRNVATTQMALHQYQQAEQSFMLRLTNLVELNQQAQDPVWIQGLLQVFATPERDQEQMQALMQNWQDQLGHTDWLEWLATDQVHQTLNQWRDLNAMQAWLDTLPEHLQALEGVAVEQQRRNQQARSLLHNDGLLQQRDNLVALLERSRADLQQIQAGEPQPTYQWMIPLADAEEREVLDELHRMRGLLSHMSGSDRVKWQARIARLEGVFFFRLQAQQAVRTQALRKQLGELQRLVADIDARVQRVSQAETHFVAGVGTNFQNFLQRADDITRLVNHARSAREELLAREIRNRMQQEMQQVQQYLLITRIAIARATDQLALNADQAQRREG